MPPNTSTPQGQVYTPPPVTTPPVPTSPVQDTSDTGLDPQVVNLAKAIRQTESGADFTAQGQSGEYGAYQFEPATWATDAAQAGVNVPLTQATPEEQNEVAYKTIAAMKAQGLNVGQIASEWNAGNPNAYLDSAYQGVNSSGAAYNTPVYAKNVATNYQNFKNGNDGTTPNQPLADTLFNPSQADKPSFLQQYGVPIAATAIGLGGLAFTGLTGGASDVAADAADTALTGAAGTTGGLLGTIGNGIKNLAIGGLGLQGAEDAYNGVKGVINDVTGKPPTDPNVNLEAQDEQDTSSEEQTQEQLAQQQQTQAAELADAQQAKAQTAQGLNTVLNQTAVGTRLAQNPLIQAGITNGLAQYGIVPTEGQDDKYTTQEDQQEVDTILSEVEDHENQLHDAEGATGSIAGIQQAANADIEKYLPETQWKEAKAVVASDLKTYQDNRGGGDEIPLGSQGVGKIRKEGYKAFDHNSSAAANGARKALGSAANSHILEKSKHKELISKLHKTKQDLIKGKEVLAHLDGKKIVKKPGLAQSLLHKYGNLLGIAIGDKVGGPLGAVLGEMIGTHLSRAVDKKYGTQLFNTPAMKKAQEILKKKNPAVYAEVKRELEKYKKTVQTDKKKGLIDNSKKNVKKDKGNNRSKKSKK